MVERPLAMDAGTGTALPRRLGQLAASVVGRRLVGGTIANLADKTVLLLVQLAAIPLLSHHWGAAGYGNWLMLMTIPAYVAVSDFGFGTAAGVEITREVAAGNYRTALAAFQSAWTFVSAIMGAIVVLAVVGVAALGAGTGMLAGGAVWGGGIVVVTLYAVVAVEMSVLTVVYRATNKYAFAMFLSAAVIGCEGIALVATVMLGGGLVEAALSQLAVRCAGTAVTFILLRRFEPWVRLGWSEASLATVRRLAHPSLAALALTLATSLSLQGMVLVLGWVAGAAAVAIFGASRFLARIPLQFSGLVMRASIPELTRAQVAGNAGLVRRLQAINIASALAPTLPFGVALAFLGPWALAQISAGQLAADGWLFVLLGLATTLNALWQALASPLVAENRQARFAYWYALGCAASLVALAAPWPSPLLAAATLMLVVEAAELAVVWRSRAHG